MVRQICIMILIIVICFSMISCEKEEYHCNGELKNTTEYYEINPLMKEYAYFKAGTYWVYQEKNTGYIDSVVVYGSFNAVYKTIIYPEINNGKCLSTTTHIEDCYIYCKSYYYNKNFEEHIYNKNITRENYFCDFQTIIDIVMYDISEYGEYSFYKKVPVLQIGNTMFNDVLITKVHSRLYNSCDIKDYFDYKEMYYYYAKNFGLIKRENLTDNEIWELVRYNIVQ